MSQRNARLLRRLAVLAARDEARTEPQPRNRATFYKLFRRSWRAVPKHKRAWIRRNVTRALNQDPDRKTERRAP